VIRALAPHELDEVGAVLGLARLYQGDGFYLVDWERGAPRGHAHLALGEIPEIQDLEVLEAYRGRGVGTSLVEAAEAWCAMTRRTHVAVTVSENNPRARALYERLGYVATGDPPRRVRGTIVLRTGPIEVDDVLVRLEKRLAT